MICYSLNAFMSVSLSLLMRYSRVRQYQKEHREASTDISDYLSNPINAYLLTKRLTSDWRVIEDYMSYDVGGGKWMGQGTMALRPDVCDAMRMIAQ